jgi:hypothetical protein
MLYLANQDIIKKWPMPIQNWANVLNQLAGAHWARFGQRFPL